MNRAAPNIKSAKSDTILDNVADTAQEKFEVENLSDAASCEIENFDELASVIIANLDKPSNKAVFERLKNK